MSGTLIPALQRLLVGTVRSGTHLARQFRYWLLVY